MSSLDAAPKAYHRSQSDEWGTPLEMFSALDKEFDFTLDAAATKENALCERFFTIEEDGLSQDWGEHNVYLNPPYSQAGKWVEKAYEASLRGATVVCLVASRTDTRWWHRWAMRADEIRLVEGRLKFVGGEFSAPFPSALLIFHPPCARPTLGVWRQPRRGSPPTRMADLGGHHSLPERERSEMCARPHDRQKGS